MRRIRIPVSARCCRGVIEQLKALSAAPLEAQDAFLTMLEAGTPERFKHIK
jgi:hypothetical protein